MTRVLAIDVGGTKLASAIVDADGTLSAERLAPTPRTAARSPAAAFGARSSRRPSRCGKACTRRLNVDQGAKAADPQRRRLQPFNVRVVSAKGLAPLGNDALRGSPRAALRLGPAACHAR
jgi:hypothetical protein